MGTGCENRKIVKLNVNTNKKSNQAIEYIKTTKAHTNQCAPCMLRIREKR